MIRHLKHHLYTWRFRAQVAAAGRRTDQQIIKPDFLGIGTARSASTWLHSRLSQHPEVYLPALKELHFFNEPRPHTPCDVSGATWTRPRYFDLDNPAHWRWYSLQFAPGADKVKGEITPDYSTLSRARVGELRAHLPEVKIILLIRNPIDRAWSGLRYSWKRHLDENLKPGEVEALMRAALHPERLLRGDYPLTLTNWEAHFPEAQRLYLLYDDIAAQPSAELGVWHAFSASTRPSCRVRATPRASTTRPPRPSRRRCASACATTTNRRSRGCRRIWAAIYRAGSSLNRLSRHYGLYHDPKTELLYRRRAQVRHHRHERLSRPAPRHLHPRDQRGAFFRLRPALF
jgi:hypothetical protein